MDQNFLLTYSFENNEGMYDQNFGWYETREEMIEDIEAKESCLKDFKIIEAIEILNSRKMELA